MNLRLTADNLFKVITGVVAAAALFILLLTGTTLLNGALPVIEKFGLYFFFGSLSHVLTGPVKDPLDPFPCRFAFAG